MQIEQSVQLDGCFVPAKASPRKQRKAEVNGRRVRRIEAGIQIDSNRIVGVHRPGDSDKDLREIREDPPVARLIGIGNSRARHLAPKSHVIKLAAY